MRYAVIPVPEQAPSYLPGLALMATTPGRRRLSRPHRTGGRGVAKDCDTKAAWCRASGPFAGGGPRRLMAAGCGFLRAAEQVDKIPTRE
jgi:hypothetical protein